LGDHDLVLGPSTDGGYGLIGLRRPANLFQSIEWGTGKVLAQTLSLAKDQGLTVETQTALRDIDTREDLFKWLPERAAPKPYLSVIIPALNEEATITAALDSAADPEAERIVVDGGSSDNTAFRATRAGARVETSLRGRAVQQNYGAQVAQGRVLLFLHADTRLPRDYVGHVFETLLDLRTVLGAFRFKTDLKHPLMGIIESGANLRSRYLHMPYGDQGLFVRKSVFRSIGGFPEVPIAEDLLLARRMSSYGHIRIAPAHVVTSARRWQGLGVLRTTLINTVIVAGLLFRVSPNILAALYRAPRKRARSGRRHST
jgi:rSAM/selenodomain-associated transferase 2